MKIQRTLPFEKDLKGLFKRFRTLAQDLEVFIRVQIDLFHQQKIDNGGIVQIPGLPIPSHIKIYKARKFACRALKGSGSKSGIRIIYAHYEAENRIEFVEIYFKGDKELEDRARILKMFSGGK